MDFNEYQKEASKNIPAEDNDRQRRFLITLWGKGMKIQPKEGQIFEHYCIGKRFVFVVTGRKTKTTRFYNVIMQGGYGSSRRHTDFEKYRLIAEYPTWQEAVNSKEFNQSSN